MKELVIFYPFYPLRGYLVFVRTLLEGDVSRYGKERMVLRI
ncbi:hypothetical protein J2Z26_001260 [Bacillus luteolus]|nr:hypothetical protein [Cytobacillus luteolus]